jgi:predicted RNA-binding protein YlqC (UPF0109 family)
MNTEEKATAYLLTIVQPLTRYPEQIEIRHHMDSAGRGIVLNVIAERDDLRLLIGKTGLMARCIRNIMRGWCELNNARVLIHVGNPISNEHHEE